MQTSRFFVAFILHFRFIFIQGDWGETPKIIKKKEQKMPAFLLNKLASGYPLALLAKIKKSKLSDIFSLHVLFENSPYLGFINHDVFSSDDLICLPTDRLIFVFRPLMLAHHLD